MSVFVNRSLNLKHIALVGFDMDYTLVRYDSTAFETLAHDEAARYLAENRGYPDSVRDLVFEPERAIVGLVIDRRNGNLLKLSRYGKVKMASHGLSMLDFRQVRDAYQNIAVELSDPAFLPLDTLFSISTGVLYAQLVHLRDSGLALPDYSMLATDVSEAVDAVHRNGAIKRVVRASIEKYVIRNPLVPALLERYRDYGKRLFIITNSDYDYTRAMLEYTLDPYWKHHRSWREVFDVVITLADKPRFFEQPGRFLKIDPESGLMSNWDGPVSSGLFQGGWFKPLQRDLGVDGREILYIGDHIYGDVVSIKKRCDWRTALVLDDLGQEIRSLRSAAALQKDIDRMMDRKAELEAVINSLDLDRHAGKPVDRARLDALFDESDRLNTDISARVTEHRRFFNPYWGEVLRAGHEESRYAGQIDGYACIYMERVADLYEHSPKTYFRPQRRLMPHEAAALDGTIQPQAGTWQTD